MNLPIPFPMFRLFESIKFKLAEAVLDNRLNEVLLSTLTEKQYTQEDVLKFLLESGSNIESLLVFRKWKINGVMRYTLEEYTKKDEILSVSVQFVDNDFYNSMVKNFNM